jgi:hypothetical protein
MKHIIQDSRSPSRDLNPESWKYEEGLLTTRPQITLWPLLEKSFSKERYTSKLYNNNMFVINFVNYWLMFLYFTNFGANSCYKSSARDD